jgi:hypothetical protein
LISLDDDITEIPRRMLSTAAISPRFKRRLPSAIVRRSVCGSTPRCDGARK